MKSRRVVSSRYLIVVTIIFALLMGITGMVVIKRTSSSMLKAIEQEGMVLTEGLILSSQNILKAGTVIEPLFRQKLLDIARFISKDSKVPSMEKLATLSSEYNLSRIDIFDLQGKLLKSSLPYPVDKKIDSILQPLLDGTESETPIDAIDNNFGVALRVDKRIITCYIDASYINDFRKETGIGALIQKMSKEKGIRYIVLQDDDGIVFASDNISSMNKIDTDTFLVNVVEKNITASRIYTLRNHKVLEVVKPFIIDGVSFGVFRVGLSLAQYNQIAEENKKHIILLIAVIFLLGAIVMNLIGLTQHYTTLDKSYSEIQSLTGSILESIGNAVVAVDSKKRITVFNQSAEKLFSISRSAIIGKEYKSVFPNDECFIELTLEKGRTIQDMTKTYTNLKGHSLILSINTNTIFNKENKIEGAVGVLRDITEMKKMEENLKEKERLSALGELAAGVAHEIRNPLNAIGITAQRIEQEFEPKENEKEFKEFINIIKNAIASLNNTVEEFLNLARPMTLSLKEEDINKVLEDVISLIQNETREKGIVITKKFNEIRPVEIDVEKLRRAIFNIALNGIQAMNSGGELFFGTELYEKNCKITIKDTGCGIPKEALKKIFIPYFSKKAKGTGLGLSITHQLVTAHKGRIEVESIEGVGTTFTIILPMKG
ncbi:MAG: ATP-binding protein [bacterium]|nr:ATP-binding protein [bacterium]